MNRFAGNRTKHIFDDQGAASASTLIPIDYGSAGVMPVKYHRADSPGGGFTQPALQFRECHPLINFRQP